MGKSSARLSRLHLVWFHPGWPRPVGSHKPTRDSQPPHPAKFFLTGSHTGGYVRNFSKVLSEKVGSFCDNNPSPGRFQKFGRGWAPGLLEAGKKFTGRTTN